MQNPVMNRMKNHVGGLTNMAWTSAAVDALDANAANTRTCPTLPSARIVKREPSRKPA